MRNGILILLILIGSESYGQNQEYGAFNKPKFKAKILVDGGFKFKGYLLNETESTITLIRANPHKDPQIIDSETHKPVAGSIIVIPKNKIEQMVFHPKNLFLKIWISILLVPPTVMGIVSIVTRDSWMLFAVGLPLSFLGSPFAAALAGIINEASTKRQIREDYKTEFPNIDRYKLTYNKV